MENRLLNLCNIATVFTPKNPKKTTLPRAWKVSNKMLENWKADKLAEEEVARAEEAVDEDDRCPECRANVGFKSLPVQKEYGNEVDIMKYLFGKGKEEDSLNVIGIFRQCPECGRKEPATEEAAVSEV